MPRNAIGTGMVDFVLPVAEMPQKLVELWQQRAADRAARTPTSCGCRREPIRAARADDRAAGRAVDAARAHRPRLHALQARRPCCAGSSGGCRSTQLRDLPTYRDYLRDTPGGDAGAAARHADQRDATSSATASRSRRSSAASMPAAVRGQADRRPGARLGRRLRDRRGGVLASRCCSPSTPASCARSAAAPGLRDRHRRGRARVRPRRAAIPEAIVADVSPERLRAVLRQGAAAATACSKALRETVMFARAQPAAAIRRSRASTSSACRNLLIYLNRDAAGQRARHVPFRAAPGRLPAPRHVGDRSTSARDLFVADRQGEPASIRAQPRVAREPLACDAAVARRRAARARPARRRQPAASADASAGELHQQPARAATRRRACVVDDQLRDRAPVRQRRPLPAVRRRRAVAQPAASRAPGAAARRCAPRCTRRQQRCSASSAGRVRCSSDGAAMRRATSRCVRCATTPTPARIRCW